MEVGEKHPEGKRFPKFIVSLTYNNPKNKDIGYPQKRRLIDNLSDHAWGNNMSIYARISKTDFPVTYLGIINLWKQVVLSPAESICPIFISILMLVVRVLLIWIFLPSSYVVFLLKITNLGNYLVNTLFAAPLSPILDFCPKVFLCDNFSEFLDGDGPSHRFSDFLPIARLSFTF